MVVRCQLGYYERIPSDANGWLDRGVPISGLSLSVDRPWKLDSSVRAYANILTRRPRGISRDNGLSRGSNCKRQLRSDRFNTTVRSISLIRDRNKIIPSFLSSGGISAIRSVIIHVSSNPYISKRTIYSNEKEKREREKKRLRNVEGIIRIDLNRSWNWIARKIRSRVSFPPLVFIYYWTTSRANRSILVGTHVRR